MSKPTFIQDSRLGRAIFQIGDEYIEVCARQFGRKIDQRFLLRTIDPRFISLSRRFLGLILIPLGFSISLGVAIWRIPHQNLFPHEVLPTLYIYLAVTLWFTIRGIPPVTFFEFRNHWGQMKFRINRDKKQAKECDAFVAELALRIEMASNGISSKEVARILEPDGPYSTQDRQPADSRFHKGKASLVFGAIAFAFSLVPHTDEFFWSVPLMFLCSLGGVVLGVYSFSSKETGRWFSLVGIVFSVIPPFIL